MSFASEIKKEVLANEDISLCCRRATTLGILHGSAEINFSPNKVCIVIKSTILNIIKFIVPQLREQFAIELDIGYSESIKSKKRRYYYLEITDLVEKISKEYQLPPLGQISLNHPYLKSKCCKAAFVRGLFASRGSVNNPRVENYHLEVTCHNEILANIVKEILDRRNINSKVISRRDNYIVYLKKGENIRDFLILIGANKGVFYFEDSRIYRDFANMANRMTNCDIANVRKCSANCQKQLDAIADLRKNGHFEKMSLRLQSAAKLREEYPDSSLEELAQYSDNVFGKKLSKSGISHCLHDLMKYYQSVIKKN